MGATTGEDAERVVAPGTAGSFEEPRHLEQRRPRGGGWRELSSPRRVRAYIGETWVDADATDVNDETREVRVVWPPVRTPDLTVHHMMLDAALYQSDGGLFEA